MSSDTDVVDSSIGDVDFLHEMLPAAEKTALLYHISYLCLANFPTLEKIIRASAVETQMVFASSESLLLMCVSTSDNMVSTLFPMLKAAVKKENAVMATKFLEKARGWIHDIIKEVERIVNAYTKLNVGVADATSDVIATKTETDNKAKQMTAEQKQMQTIVDTYRAKLNDIQKEMKDCNNKINNADKELRNLINSISSRNAKFGIFAAVCPFLGWIVYGCQKAINNPKDSAAIELARSKLSKLQQNKSQITNREWMTQTELMNNQMQLTKAKFDLGAVPDTVHLAEVQTYLSRIQEILLKLKSFWETIGILVDDLEKKTFSTDLVEVLQDADFKECFLISLDSAAKSWTAFKCGCLNVRRIFKVQSKDTYRFLDISPSSLSKEDWQKQYDEVNAKLRAFYPALLAKQASGGSKAIQ